MPWPFSAAAPSVCLATAILLGAVWRRPIRCSRPTSAAGPGETDETAEEDAEDEVRFALTSGGPQRRVGVPVHQPGDRDRRRRQLAARLGGRRRRRQAGGGRRRRVRARAGDQLPRVGLPAAGVWPAPARGSSRSARCSSSTGLLSSPTATVPGRVRRRGRHPPLRARP